MAGLVRNEAFAQASLATQQSGFSAGEVSAGRDAATPWDRPRHPSPGRARPPPVGRKEYSDSITAHGLLRLGGKRRENEPDSENDREPDQSHWHLGGGWLAGV